MDPHPLTAYVARLLEEHGAPQVLDVEHSVQVYKPTLTGSSSPASYYIAPPPGMTAEEFIAWFEAAPDFLEFRLTLVPILGLDTYHQPLISTDDFARKHFHDNQQRFVRVVGKSNAAIESMLVFVDALKRPFEKELFPHHSDFAVSAYRPPEEGRATELKLLYTPADHNDLLKVERLVSVYLEECNLGREIGAYRHSTRTQPPELIMISNTNAAAGVHFLAALEQSLPQATAQEVAEATVLAQNTLNKPAAESAPHMRFTQPQAVNIALTGDELKRKIIGALADVLRASRFANGADVAVSQRGLLIEIPFPKSAASLWLASTFREKVHIRDLSNACMGIKTDPTLRDGWSAAYYFDSKPGKLQIRVIESPSQPPPEWKLVQ